MEDKNKKNRKDSGLLDIDNDDLDNELFGDDTDDDVVREFVSNDGSGDSREDMTLDEDGMLDDLSDGSPEDDKEVLEVDFGSAGVVMSATKIKLIHKLLRNIKDNTEQIESLMSGLVSNEDEDRIGIGQLSDEEMIREKVSLISADKVIEGIFDGEKMIGPDGKQYTVPSNYASKSKLIEGDMMKLTITRNGTFVYKQIGPIERSRIVGGLERDEDGNYFVTFKNKKWRVLTASVTYFRGDEGDEAVILVPKIGESKWAAVENIIKTS
jgi:hypothetical protein